MLERIDLFAENPRNPDPILKNHPLLGKKEGLFDFHAAGDCIVIYYKKEGNFYLYDIGTHNQLRL
ncbi:MAG TPA: hypothetical protein ENI23_03355 [bacterium]|nr:hypothetical protein [bacterium]